MPLAQMFSLLSGNISFFFAFGYFCARSSQVIKFLERKRQEGSLRNAHKLLATGYLMSGTAHDILNHLASIKGYAQVLLERAKEGSNESQMLKAIIDLELRSKEFLYRLARFSRGQAQKFESANLHGIIEDALSLTWPLVRYSKMDVQKMFGTDIPFIMANREQLQEVFVALILNALDAIPTQGTLTIKTAYLEKNNVVEIIFSDTGAGIKREDLNRIGEPFFTTKGPERGSGLGLATAYGIIARHNGKIGVESTPDKGTIFTIQLPIMQLSKASA
jgi:signal transduction histidine kinase